MKKADERDIIFSRLTYTNETPAYKEYYARNPQMLTQDEIFRNKPVMGDKSALMYDPLYSPISDACFEFLGDIKSLCVGSPKSPPVTGCPEQFTKTLTGLATFYGAKLVGVAKLETGHYYSHKGRPMKEYGKEVQTDFPYAIVFAVEMEKDMIFSAPRQPESVAVTKGYVDAAVIGMILSYYIRNLGYQARNNMDGNYIMPLQLVAQSAGLGEIGQNGLLITKSLGPRIRLGAVCTDIPLIANNPHPNGIKEFCKLCMRCKKNCPAKAIADDSKMFNSNACFTIWQKYGSDCGICMASCPFSLGLSGDTTSLLATPEGRAELMQYLDTHYPKKPYIKDNPDWMYQYYSK